MAAMAPVSGVAPIPAAAASPAAAVMAAMVYLHGVAGNLVLYAGCGGRDRNSLSGKAEKRAGCDRNRKYILFHE